MLDIDKELAKAVKHYWKTRAGQKQRQGGKSGLKDAGNRSAVTGGKHADEFVNLIAAIVRERRRVTGYSPSTPAPRPSAPCPATTARPRNGTWWCSPVTIWSPPWK